jgi:undecaprenyl-phosphate 4-deoxy-4-formamido-L-arabinose transferase
MAYGVPSNFSGSPIRIIGSQILNKLGDTFLNKPKGIYISNFRCISKTTYKKLINNKSKHFWLDHLVFKNTKSIDSIVLTKNPRQLGKTNYSYIKLLNFIFNIFYSIIYNNIKILQK